MPYLRGSTYARRSRRRYVTPSTLTGLRGSFRRSSAMMGVSRRKSLYVSRPLRRTRALRRRKMYRRTLPSTRQRTRAIASGLVEAPVEDKVNGTVSAFELAIRDVRGSNNTVSVNGDNYISFRMGTIYFQSVPWPYPSSVTTSNAFDSIKRNNNHINVHGIKIDRRFTYRENGPSIGPIVVNWCLIQGRSDVSASEIASALTNNTFREHSSIVNETYSWEQYAVDSTWKDECNYLPLNPDNKYKVLTHRRMVLQPDGLERGNGSGVQRQMIKDAWNQPHRWEIKRWYKIGKTFSFEDDSSATPQKNIYEVFWYNTQDARRFPVNPIGLSYVETIRRNVLYYSEN